MVNSTPTRQSGLGPHTDVYRLPPFTITLIINPLMAIEQDQALGLQRPFGPALLTIHPKFDTLSLQLDLPSVYAIIIY